jgi:hypothetical protein
VARLRPSAASGPTEPPKDVIGLSRALNLGHQHATIVAMRTESLRQVRDHLSEVVDRVEREHERVMMDVKNPR